jgi:curli biogenesis system outer membrane secretion channel CsgG
VKLRISAVLVLVALAACAPRKSVNTVNEPDYMKGRSSPENTVNDYRGPKRRVAVIAFDNKTPYGQRELGTSASDILVTELQKTGQFILIEREKVQHILDEQRFQSSDLVEPMTVAKVGRLLGASAIITGAVTQFGQKEEGVEAIVYQRRTQKAECTIDLRVVDVATGEIVVADSGRGEAEQTVQGSMGLGGRSSYDSTLAGDALRAAIFKFSKNVVTRMQKVPWSARVAEVEGGKIYLDAGMKTQVPIGAELEVLRPGKEIISPTTGKSMGQTTSAIGTVKVTEYFGEDGSVASVVTGNIAAKDIVRLKNPQ